MERRNKYGNKKCIFEGIEFASKKEMQRYLVLRQAQDNGLISNLTLQPKFELIPRISEQVTIKLKTKDKTIERFVQHPINYVGDFSYIKDGKQVVEDVKASPKSAALDSVFLLKEKIFRWRFGFAIKRVYKGTDEI